MLRTCYVYKPNEYRGDQTACVLRGKAELERHTQKLCLKIHLY